MTVDAATFTPASTGNIDAIWSFQISGIGFNLFDVVSPTAAIVMKNGREMKYESDQAVPQLQTPQVADKTFDFDPTGAGPGAVDDWEYIFAWIKYWCNKILMVVMIVIYYTLGMIVFDLFFFRCTQYASWCIWICFVFFLIQN